MTVGVSKRARLSLFGASALFLFIFSGLFCGFLIAHFFPEQVIHLLYGVGTEPPVAVVVPAAGSMGTTAPSSLEQTQTDEGSRERDLSVSARLQSTMESSGPAAETKPAQIVVPRFVARRKPASPSLGPVAPEPPGPAISSFLPAAQYPLAAWNQIEARAGFVDSVTIASTGTPLAGNMPKADDVLDIVGWVGDPILGARFKDVVFALCGKIVGHAKVGLPRPDVAQAVHPNLAPSGWRGRLYVGYLPRCPDPTLSVLGVIPGSSTVLPVGSPVALKLPPPESPPPGAPKGAPAFTPKNVTMFRSVPIDVVVDNAELRRCGATDCETVAHASKGRYQGHVVEEAEGWVLIVLPDKAGWLPRAQAVWGR